MQLHGEQSHLVGISDSPCFRKNAFEKDEIEVPVETFDIIDTGFDSVVFDMEGAEWFALKNMVSRPRFLMIETHSSKTAYRNPYLKEINQWAQTNGYAQVHRGISNTIWTRE